MLLRLLGAHGATLNACGHSIERLVRVRDGLAEQVRSLNGLIEEMHGQAELARERQGEVRPSTRPADQQALAILLDSLVKRSKMDRVLAR